MFKVYHKMCMIQKWSYKVNLNEAMYMFVLPVAELISGYRMLFKYLKIPYQIEYKYMYSEGKSLAIYFEDLQFRNK